MPLVSVIVPVYKVEKVIENCINSILSQSFIDFELILVDDGSPDKSGEICDRYAKIDNRINVIHKENGGVSSARNIGVDNAKGKYICFVDSDDYVSDNYIKALVDTKEKYNNVDNVWCYFKTVSNYEYGEKDLKMLSKIAEEKYNVKDIMTLHEKWLDAGPVCKLYNASIVKNNNLKFDENLSLGEDLIFNFMYLDYTDGNIVVVNKELYYYFQDDENSLSKKYYSDMFEIYKKINSTMFNYLKKWECDDIQLGKYYNSCFFKYEVVLKNTFDEKNNIDKKEKFRFNNKVLRSEEFVTAFNNMTYKPNILYRLAYCTKEYKIIMFVDSLFKLLGRN